jgi:hypothetical protein
LVLKEIKSAKKVINWPEYILKPFGRVFNMACLLQFGKNARNLKNDSVSFEVSVRSFAHEPFGEFEELGLALS